MNISQTTPSKNGQRNKMDTQMANRHGGKCSTLLEKCKSKLQWGITSLWSECPSSSLERTWRKKAPSYSWWECKLVQPQWRAVWSFLKKLKAKLPHDLAISLQGIYPKKITIQKDTCTPFVHCSTINNSQHREAT